MSAGKGKRGPEVLQGTLSSSSDEDSPRAVPMSHVISPQMTMEPLSSVVINNFGDHDYEHYDVSSPSGSSTVSAGNSVCERRPGFTEYAREVPRRPKQKKKKPDAGSSFAERSQLSETTSVSAVAMPHGTVNFKMLKHPVVPRPKPHRDPVPMRMRALPQSMWQEPNVPHDVSPATQYPVLPPLVTREGDDIAAIFTSKHALPMRMRARIQSMSQFNGALRPVTPPEEREEREREKAARDKSQKISGNGFTAGSETSRRYGRLSERTVSVANPDLLMRLFDAVEKANPTPTAYFSGGSQFKKGRLHQCKIPGCSKNGLVHRSQMSNTAIDKPDEIMSLGEKVFCKVLSAEPDGSKIALSMKVVSQTTGKDLDPGNVQAALDERRKKSHNSRDMAPIELGAVLDTTCRKCGGKGHLAQDCFHRPGDKTYELVDEDVIDAGIETSARSAVTTDKHHSHKSKKHKKRKLKESTVDDDHDDDEQSKHKKHKKKKFKSDRHDSPSRTRSDRKS